MPPSIVARDARDLDSRRRLPAPRYDTDVSAGESDPASLIEAYSERAYLVLAANGSLCLAGFLAAARYVHD